MEQTISRMESSSSTTSICSPTMGMQVLGKKLIITSFPSNGNGECLNFGNPKRDTTILLTNWLISDCKEQRLVASLPLRLAYLLLGKFFSIRGKYGYLNATSGGDSAIRP